MKWSDLFDDATTGRVSTTKLWMHISNVVMSWVVIKQTVIGWELLAAYGGIVGSSHVAIYWLGRKYGNSNDCSDVSKE